MRYQPKDSAFTFLRRIKMIKKILLGGLILIAGIGIFAYTKLSIFTIQPIGAIPDGVTLIVWKKDGDPFFNSADAICLKKQGYVNLWCRGLALGNSIDEEDIIYKLPYSEYAYLKSTGGKDF